MCEVYSEPDPQLDEALDEIQRSLESRVNKDLHKQAAQLAMFHELVAALEKANARCFDLGHGFFETEKVLDRAKDLL